MRNDEIKDEIYEIKSWKNKIKQKDLKYETNKYVFDFQRFATIRSFGESIYNGKIKIDEAEMKQTNLLENIMNFSNKSRPRSKKEKDKKQNAFDSINTLYEGRELILNAFRSGIFPMKEKKGKGIKILTPKQIIQRLQFALAQVKAGNTSENLLNKIRQIIYSLYGEIEVTKKVHNNLVNSIKV